MIEIDEYQVHTRATSQWEMVHMCYMTNLGIWIKLTGLAVYLLNIFSL